MSSWGPSEGFSVPWSMLPLCQPGGSYKQTPCSPGPGRAVLPLNEKAPARFRGPARASRARQREVFGSLWFGLGYEVGCSDVGGNQAEFVSVCFVSNTQATTPDPEQWGGAALPARVGLPAASQGCSPAAAGDKHLPVPVLMLAWASTLVEKLPEAPGGNLTPGKG